ncbi:MAG TPA: efflux RND transporter periplasmic adaptor subunit [Candidatus Binatia bacterium]|jgi:RND family efflux transporter MFP subunit
MADMAVTTSTSHTSRAPLFPRRATLLLLLAALAACHGNTYAPPPPPEVTVVQPVQQEVTTYSEFTGHTASVEAVDIRARVQGFLESINFVPGSDVTQGDLLFVIEPDLYQARVDQAQATLQSAQAQSQAAEAQLAITHAIFERNAGSRTDLVTKTQARDQAAAAVLQARANLQVAKLDLSYTHIYAPITGRIDRNLVDAGNLVGAGESTVLASIVRQDRIYAYFDASERDLLRYRELNRRGQTVAAEGQHNVAYLGLATEEGYPHLGDVDYSSNRVNPDTGTIEIRAVFSNPDRVLLPGLFARVRLPFTRGQATLVPDVAIGTDQGGRFVLIVDENDVVQQRRVQVAGLVDTMRALESGVTPSDWVVVNGLQRARPGAKVKPTRTTVAQLPGAHGTPSPAAPAAPSASPSPGPP